MKWHICVMDQYYYTKKRVKKQAFGLDFHTISFFEEGLRLILGKPPESGSARLGHIPSLPWEPQLPLKPYLLLQPLNFKGNCDSLRFSPRFLLQFLMQFSFASQMWAARPHLGSIFEKLLHRKTFICLRLVIGNIFLRETSRIRFGKARAHPQLALGIAIAPETLSFITTSQFKRVGCLLFCDLDWLQESSRRQNKKFFDPTIF